MERTKKGCCGKPRSKSAPALLRTPTKRKKRKQWSEEAMVAALDAVKEDESVFRASREQGIGIPRQTFHDQINGKVVHGTKPGPKPLLSFAEETEL